MLCISTNKSDWSVEKVTAILQGFIPLITLYFENKRNDGKFDSEYLRIISKHNQKIVIILLTFLGSLMMALIILTLYEKIDGASLLFAIGLSIGYVFAIIQKFIFSSQSSSVETES